MPSTKVRPIGHEDRLSIVDHLDELRTRLMICIAALVFCFAFTYWQNGAILDAVNQPFTDSQKSTASTAEDGGDALEQSALFNRSLSSALLSAGRTQKAQQDVIDRLAQEGTASAALAKELREASASLRETLVGIQATARVVPDAERDPVTLGVTEPFITTFTVAGYAALLLALPLILFQLYAFLLPAFSPQEKKTAVPFMVMVPILFVAGVAFGYFVALPRAVDFLLNFNDDNFDILVGAKDYYKFSILLLLIVGLLFQIPIAVLAITSLGIVTPQQLAKNRGYVLLGVAVVAAVATPTPDPFTMLFVMAPLILLFEGSLLVARIIGKRSAGKPSRWDWDDEDEDDEEPEDDDPYGFNDPPPGGDAEPDGDPGDEEDHGDDPEQDDADAVAASIRADLGGEAPSAPPSSRDV